MESNHEMNDLWGGGRWEQGTLNYPSPPTVHIPPSGKPQETAKKRPKKRKMQNWFAFSVMFVIILALTATIVALLQGDDARIFKDPGEFGYDEWYNESTASVPPTMPTVALPDGLTVSLAGLQGEALSTQDIYGKNLPSIVHIEAWGDDGGGTGTGIVLTEDGYIITNAHVISGAETANVLLWDNTLLQAKLVGWNGEEDLAVIKVEADTPLVPAEFGDSSKLRVGDLSYAMGNPLGEDYRSTFTDGMISGLDRYISVDDVYMNLIQTTAAINFGNSGGALLNEEGQVVGITTIKIMSDEGTIEGMGFAIPTVRVKKVVDTLLAGGELRTPVLGVTVVPTDDPMRGILIVEVNDKSMADEAGLMADDVIIRAAGEEVFFNSDLARVKNNLNVGDELELIVVRNGEELTILVQLVDAETIG